MRRSLPLLILVAVALSTAAAAPPTSLVSALASQRQLVAASPSDAKAWNDLGNLLFMAAEPVAAGEAYERALALDPALTSARFNLALLELQAGELREAESLLRAVVEDEPDNAWAWFELGVIAERQGRERPAVAAYTRAFALDPRLTFADVNPQIIDSRLVTRALLRFPAGELAASEAPRAYERPDRIATLLVPEAEEIRAEAERQAEAEPAMIRGRAGAAGAPTEAALEEVAEEEDLPGTRVVGRDDIDPSRRGTGQATPVQGGYVGPRAAPVPVPGPAAPGVRRMAPPVRTVPAPPAEGYQPGTPSSAFNGLERRPG